MSSLVIAPSANTQMIGSLLIQATQLGFAPKIFISSTIDDLNEYREAVATALKPSALCLMIKDWTDGHWDVVEVCRHKVDESYGYIGIFAYYYGSIPPGQSVSITHLEYQWVRKKWQTHPNPPIVVFMPDEKATIHASLKETARGLVSKRYSNPDEHDKLLKNFHTEVLDWHIVKFFADAADLQIRAVHAFYNWGNLLMNVAQGTATVQETNQHRSTVENLIGLLGRDRQIDALKDIHLTVTKASKIVPATCIMVYGDEYAGHDEFVKQTVVLKQLRQDKKEVVSGRPPLKQYDVKTLLNWIAENLGILEQPIDTPEDLALLVWDELKSQQLAIILDDLNGLSGGLQKFHESLWRPFYKKLADLSALKKVKYPLLFILVMRNNFHSVSSDIVQRYIAPEEDERSDEFDYSKLVAIPKLGRILEKHVIDWLEKLHLEDKSDEDLRKIADEVLKDESGMEDSRPVFVYKRIRFLSL